MGVGGRHLRTLRLLAPVYDVVAARQPGFPARDDAWWEYRLHDPEHRRHGSSALQCVVTDGGYALYAVAPAWSDGRPAGAVEVRELVAADEGARTRLWRYLLDLDLSTEVRARSLAPDDPLLLTHLADPRAARSLLRDGLWVRLLDVPTALAARCYACDIDVVPEVEDRRCPWNTGRRRLSGGRDDAACEPTSAPADLLAVPEDLGAAYFGRDATALASGAGAHCRCAGPRQRRVRPRGARSLVPRRLLTAVERAATRAGRQGTSTGCGRP